MVNNLVISASSDIGFEYVKDRSLSGEKVVGTFRDTNAEIKINKYCDHSIFLDLFDKKSINQFIKYIENNNITWERLLFCPCQPFPYKSFFDSDFKEWEESFNINSLYQLEILHKLFKFRKKSSKVLFFAGGGSNSAVENFSAYTSAKIHLTKMVELLDYENADISFSILGPGWVKTKNHLLALKHAKKNSDKFITTKNFLDNPKGATPINDVIASINWIFDQEKKIIGGRNFSTAFDPWGEENPSNGNLLEKLNKDFNMYKLRRHGNNFFPKKRY